MPRPSKNQHPLATLRATLGLGQKELAALAGCTKSAIQRIELNQLKPRVELLQTISRATGADLDWLLKGDYQTPPLGSHGGPLTRPQFERLRMWRDQRMATDEEMARLKGYDVGLQGAVPVPGAELRLRFNEVQRLPFELVLSRKGQIVPPPKGTNTQAVARRLMHDMNRGNLWSKGYELIEQFVLVVRAALSAKDGDLLLWQLRKAMESVQTKHRLKPKAELKPEELMGVVQWLEGRKAAALAGSVIIQSPTAKASVPQPANSRPRRVQPGPSSSP